MKEIKRQFHRQPAAMLPGLLMAGSFLAAQPVQAQQATPAVAAADELAEVTVTGSRIQRRDASSVGPLLTLTEEDIARSGASSVGDLLQKLPSAGVSLNSNGTQGTSYGASSINLRYLGGGEGSGNRVLVLVDGHRWVDAVGQRGFRDFVDLNTIPLGLIEGIEVLKDGASAIYGADAIAGVVNIKTLQPFSGLRASLKAGATTHGDGAERSATIAWGYQSGRASWVLTGSYQKANAIRTDARALTTLSLVPVTAPGTNPNGLYILPGLSSNAFFGTASGFASTASPVVFNGGATYGAGNQADNSYHVAALPGDFYNTQAQGIYSAGPSDRHGLSARFDFALSDDTHLRLEALYNRRKSDQLFSPVLLDIGGSAGTVRGFAIPNNQAFNPFGTANGVPTANALAFGATSAWRIRKVLNEVGNRDNLQDVQTTRFAAGLDGHFQLFGERWSWDATAAYSKNKIDSLALNGVNYDALYLGLGSPTACAAASGCVPINLFAPMTDAQASYVRYTTVEYNANSLYDVSLNATGRVFDLPGGPAALAVGYEYRNNRGEDRPDAYANAASQFLAADVARTTAQTRTVTNGSYHLHELYAELALPLLKDRPLARSLEVSLASRYSKYSTVGGKLTGKMGVGYRPVQSLLVRGTYSQGFRAPSVLELYQGARQTSFQGTDPCNGGATINAALPGCAGVPAGYNQINYNLNGLIPGVISGNARLKPETADTISAGISITPAAVSGLTWTIDYYKIKIKDAIASQSATQILQLCAVRGGVFCDLVTRDRTTGAITTLLQGAQNLNSIDTDGIDSTLRYDFTTRIGRFGAVLDASYLHSFSTSTPNPTGGAAILDERAGKGDQPRSTYPHWKGQASLSWTRDPLDVVLRARYIGPTTDVANTVKDANTASILYTDVEFGLALQNGRWRVGAGVNNLFDEQPPASYANAPINYDIYTYDARGRFPFVRVALKL